MVSEFCYKTTNFLLALLVATGGVKYPMNELTNTKELTSELTTELTDELTKQLTHELAIASLAVRGRLLFAVSFGSQRRGKCKAKTRQRRGKGEAKARQR